MPMVKAPLLYLVPLASVLRCKAAQITAMIPVRAGVVGIGVADSVWASPLHQGPIAPPVGGPLDHVVFRGGVNDAGAGAEGCRMDPKPLPGSGCVPVSHQPLRRFSRR